MPTYLGEDGTALAGATAIGNIENFSYNEEGSKVATPFMGATAIVELAGKPRVNGTIRMWWDPADAGQLLLVQGATTGLTLRPLGNGSGLAQMVLTAVDIDTEALDVPVEAGVSLEVAWSATAKANRAAQP